MVNFRLVAIIDCKKNTEYVEVKVIVLRKNTVTLRLFGILKYSPGKIHLNVFGGAHFH